MVSRAVLAHRLLTGVSRRHLGCLVEVLAVSWQAGVEGRRHAARGGIRKRAAGTGARHQLVFVDRLVATLIHLRHDLPHSVLGLLFGVDRSTITRAIGEIRPLLAERGCAVPDRPGLRALPDVFAYAQAEGVELRLDATEIQVRRPQANRGGRRAFVSGKKKQNTMKATVIADWQGRTLWTDALRPGRMHDATAARNEGIAICFQHFPDVEVLLDDGYLGLSRDHRGQANTPPRKPRPGALPGRVEQGERDRHGHSSDRITVEHALADHKRWKQPTRWTHRRDRLPDTYRAIVGLVSDQTRFTRYHAPTP
ncbi:transposase family protein [Streptomyces sp. NPDC017448]|uniref:transposase family protein n=1 Tax=Streptomyces sp. NPDC017448 TaxID=3364996 RepID=UPI003796BC51